MSEKKSIVAEFKEFIARGNVMDLAVGVIIGGAFNGIVSSLCDDVIMPAIQLLIGTVAGDKYINPETNQPDFEMMTKALNVGTIKFGAFISAIITFIILAFVVFLIVRAINKARKKAEELKKKEAEAPKEPTTKICPFCQSEISIKATRCPHCTSELPKEE